MLHLCRNEVVGFYQQNVCKTLVKEWHFTESVTVAQVFLAHFVFKNQVPDLFVSRKFVGNGLNISFKPFIHNFEKRYLVVVLTPQDL